MLTILFLLLFVHYLADYPLQGDFLAKAKNHNTRTLPDYAVGGGVPGVPWYQALFAHAFIQAGFVYLVTGCMGFALAELVLHFAIDYCKSAGGFQLSGMDGACARTPCQCEACLRFAYNFDQLAHVACKVCYVLIAYYSGIHMGLF
jgi:hypothetical protein